MSTYTIGEVADRTGFTTSALRYYEHLGLLAPTARTGSGYRVYDERAVTRLAFISRAKQLGCSLDEIADLVEAWDGERCAPVQDRLHELVLTRVADARRQIAELTTLVAQLEDAAHALAGDASEGPCGEGCACLSRGPSSPAQQPTSVEAGVEPSVDPPGGPAIACTLEPGAVGSRIADWDAALRGGRRVPLDGGGLRVELVEPVALDELARLVDAERRCCAFFSFAVTVDDRGIALEVRAPEGADALVEEVFGRPS